MRFALLVLAVWALAIIALTHKAPAAELSMCGPISKITDRLAEEGEQPVLAFIYDVNIEVPQLRILFAGTKSYTLLVGGKGPDGQDGYFCTMYSGDVVGVNLPK